MKLVKISVKNLLLEFQGCDAKYIKEVCKGRCCHIASLKEGTTICVEKHQQAALKGLGAKFKKNIMQTKGGKCIFFNSCGTCKLHGKDLKPRSCIISPFMLTAKDTLIIRNRYKMLKCYKAAPALPAYEAFKTALILIFGKEKAGIIRGALKRPDIKDFYIEMPDDVYAFMKHRDDRWHKNIAKEIKDEFPLFDPM